MDKTSIGTLPPFAVPSPVSSLASEARRIWQDLQPTPGRLNTTLRIVLATILSLLALLILQVPFASLALYFVFLIERESPAVSLRTTLAMVPVVVAVAIELGVVILTDNDPMARVLSVAAISFLGGLLAAGTTVPMLGAILGLVYGLLIAAWEFHAPANALVNNSLWIISAISIPALCSVAVEYIFGSRRPADLLQEESTLRWQALISMFTLFAEKAPHEARTEAVSRVSRLAVAGQDGMQELYNRIAERDMDTGSLPPGARVRITMLAQLMDVAAALGSAPYADNPESLQRYTRIAEQARAVSEHSPEATRPALEARTGPNLTLLDRVEGILHAIRSMPAGATAKDKHLVALPSNKVPLFVPGALTDRASVAFGLKISFCATLCYILYHAIDYPGISTSVTTVFITGLSTTGAIKQKFVYRLLGSAIGGLIFGLGATAFLFPHMDSITSLVVLVAIIAFIAAWCSLGRQFGYVGLQIAYSFFIVAFEGFSAPTELAPARDRLVGILLALVVMWFVFDQIWPVRTVTAMRRSLAVILRSGAKLFRWPETVKQHADLPKEIHALRDQVGKTVAAIRTMNGAVEYEFVVDRELHIHSSGTILRAALTAAALFWNQVVFLQSKRERELLDDPRLVEMRNQFATIMEVMADAVAQKKAFTASDPSRLADPSILADPRYREYLQNALARFRELQDCVQEIGVAV